MPKQSKRVIVLEQIELQEELQSKGFNVVECGNCGSILLHRTNQEKINCFCGTKDVSDCPDLYYSGIENNEEFN